MAGLHDTPRTYPLTLQFYGLLGGAPCTLAFWEPLDGHCQLGWHGRLTTAFTIDTGPLNQDLELRSFLLIPKRMDLVPDRDHELIQVKLLVTTSAPYVRGTITQPSESYAVLWTPFDQIRLLGSGTFSLFVA